MSSRRPSLIDQMAMVAASQMSLAEADMRSISSSDEYLAEADAALDDDDLLDNEDATEELVFQTDLQQFEEEEEAFTANDDLSQDSEAMDHFGEASIPMAGSYWGSGVRRSSVKLEDSAVSSDNNISAVYEQLEQNDEELGAGSTRRASFKRPSFRRPSFQSAEGSDSLNSTPTQVDGENSWLYETAEPDGSSSSGRHRRPGSISVSSADSDTRHGSHSFRRTSVNIKPYSSSRSLIGSHANNGSDDSQQTADSQSGTNSSSLRSFGRRSTRRTNLSIQVRADANGTFDKAIESLRNQDSNSEWENVAAAVTVVAAGSQGTTKTAKTPYKQFTANETVLVFLTLLNVTNTEDPKDTFTIAPVNKCGFPAGEGITDLQKSGPYTFVMATVKYVHFDEDDRYYTVIRADTESEQRADSGWMEPLKDHAGIEAATRAAKRTVRTVEDRSIDDMEDTGILQNIWDCFMDAVSWPADFFLAVLLPWYRQQRANAKLTATRLLYGDAPFSCKVRLTGINFLVCCSFCFLFLEVINLAFLPVSYDGEVAIVGMCVWIILAVELLFEILIRPKNYFELIESDKAFAPSTARYINRFHFCFELLALLTFIPEFRCLGKSAFCVRSSVFSRVQASSDAVFGETHAVATRGRFLMGITVLRFFGVVRHWKQMWISNTLRPEKRQGLEKWLFPEEKNVGDTIEDRPSKRKKFDDLRNSDHGYKDDAFSKSSSEEDQRLKNAATIGTALMVVNSQRALILVTAIVLVVPLLGALVPQNHVKGALVALLQANNLAAEDDCSFLETAIDSWLKLAMTPQPESFLDAEDTFVLWARVLPVRCDFQREDGVVTTCDSDDTLLMVSDPRACRVWAGTLSSSNPLDTSSDYFAEALDLRVNGLSSINSTLLESSPEYQVEVVFNDNPTIALGNMGLFFLLCMTLFIGLYGLQALRGFAFRLVLDPLQRMLKIVLRYAENPLSRDVRGGSMAKKLDEEDNEAEEIGNYETEQLINAITKIADLLRKCWGVAGAGIISSNLARTKDGKTVVFNPTVPGKRVYALFGFVAINGFGEQLRALDRDVMILINDVAKVVHDEVYRWALGDHGQCNKNLGSAFLMVFRIGDFSEVQKKKQVATEKLFRDTNTQKNTRKVANLRRRLRSSSTSRYVGRTASKQQDVEGHLQLASLPGIQTFTDRALLGMLKSFAGLHRDKSLNVWKSDFRLSAGVSAYHVDVIYGMDAGWAVEGAVGSEYKIDATYLSPHVNMASRMMSATKQYGVTILLSKAVEELLSVKCRKKLRRLDTVYVKGSKVKQDIYTYDARHRGVDFFLIERTPEQADLEAESYTPHIWDTDQDLRAMRQHVSDEFLEIYNLAVKQYLAGSWEEAYGNFGRADKKMIETVLEDGYFDFDLEELEGRIFDEEDQQEDVVAIRNELGDGACRTLRSYMERRKLVAPADWDAVRQLYSK